jgi:hypothetical protein
MDSILHIVSFYAFSSTIHENRNNSFILTNIEIIVIILSFSNLLNHDPSICYFLAFYQGMVVNNKLF